jgi:hypothetical protein
MSAAASSQQPFNPNKGTKTNPPSNEPEMEPNVFQR